MKLLSLRLTTLKSKLYAIVFASFVVRVIIFLMLPKSPSQWVPDEFQYAQLTEIVAKGLPVDESAFGSGFYQMSRALILPASLLARIGLNGLDSVRIISSLYGLLTVALAAFVLLKLSTSSQENSKSLSNNTKTVLLLLTIFTFLPSHIIFSILGMRESATEFWVMLTFSIVFYIFHIKKELSKRSAVSIAIVIPLVFSARPQVGWVLGATLLTFYFFKIRVKPAQILIPITVIGLLMGYVATTVFEISKTEIFTARMTDTPSPTATTPTEYNASLLCKFVGQEVLVGSEKFKCTSKVEKKIDLGLNNIGAVVLDRIDTIPRQQEVNQLNANSVIKIQACPNSGITRFEKYFCMAYRAPYSTFTFLVRPILGPDVTSTSSFLAAVENVFWFVALFYIIVMFIRNRRLAFFSAIAPSLLFFSLYSVGAGAYEGNMGTAFRHKSLILWVVLLLIASTIVATGQRKAEQQGISSSSKE